jgi:hypothetical protein
MVKLSTTLFILFSFLPIEAAKKAPERVLYFSKLFGHIHKNPSRYSQSLSTIGCGHPTKVIGNTEVSSSGVSFLKVKVGPYVGYISKIYLRSKKPQCFADDYPRFFDNLNLSLTDMYYWGKLYDQYITGRSRVK